jgi:hypothetical protein
MIEYEISKVADSGRNVRESKKFTLINAFVVFLNNTTKKLIKQAKELQIPCKREPYSSRNRARSLKLIMQIS